MRTPTSKPKLEVLDARLVPAMLIVDDDGGEFPGAPYSSIQSAIDAAAPGDTVLVYPGQYQEKLTVGPGKSNVTLQSETPLGAVISLPPLAPAYTSVINIDFSTGVRVLDFTIAGPGSYPTQIFAGIEVNQGATANITGNLITDISDSPGSGDQNGFGVYVGYVGGGRATIVGNTFTRYQKSGVVVDGPNGYALIDGNEFVGNGPTSLIAQNGIDVVRQGSADIFNNSISSHIYTGPVGPDPENPVTASGVIIHQAKRVTVRGNFIDVNQTGVYVSDQSWPVTIQNNQLAGNTLDGITLDLARGGVSVLTNTVEASGRDGIHIQSASSNNTVRGNTVTDSGRHGIATVPTKFGVNLDNEVAPTGNVITRNVVSGSAAFDLYSQSANWDGGGLNIQNLWSANTHATKNRPGLR
jgi:parallel beta-helix repeat protein